MVSSKDPKKVSKDMLLEMFEIFDSGSETSGAIDNWLTKETPDDVLERLLNLNNQPITFAIFNELLILAKVSPVSKDFFIYYWLEIPKHPYDPRDLPKFETDYKIHNNKGDEDMSKKNVNIEQNQIVSLDHLYWGIYRIFMDGLLFYGNISRAYHDLREKSHGEIESIFKRFIFDHEKMVLRGPTLDLIPIDSQERHLISEAACKNLDVGSRNQLLNDLKESYRMVLNGLLEKNKQIHEITVKEVVANLSKLKEEKRKNNSKLKDLETSDTIIIQKSLTDYNTTLGSIYEEKIDNPAKLTSLFNRVVEAWEKARPDAIANTRTYLAKIGELDVYVATSMRTIEDFIKMTDLCNYLFKDEPEENASKEDIEIHRKLKKLYIRYFDPTLSAARGHEDKGLIECLMVKLAKVLILYVGTKDSYGKDVEAAMALSLGKPVIFLSEDEDRLNFYKNVHPLSRLINFDNGVAVGALICKEKKIAKQLLYRIFYNKMQYYITRPESGEGEIEKGYYQLKEKLTNSVVRIQTNDQLLTRAFWDHYS
ncbi:MAG: hypothetical protein ACFE8A_12400 [Candidatus Hodarchaeota archaeon]